MTTGRKFSDAENAIVRNGVLASRTCPQISADLMAAGFQRSHYSINGTRAYSDALVERRQIAEAKAVETAPRDRVTYGDLVLRKTVRIVHAQHRASGEFIPVPVSLSAGVGWQVPA